MSAPTELACSGCRHRNRGHRAYCGRCGTTLQPICRGCRFINDATDGYCGGCGNMLISHEGRGTVVDPSRVAVDSPPAAAAHVDEMTDLFHPVVSSNADDHLPSAGITQSDLDRLFGGAS